MLLSRIPLAATWSVAALTLLCTHCALRRSWAKRSRRKCAAHVPEWCRALRAAKMEERLLTYKNHYDAMFRCAGGDGVVKTLELLRTKLRSNFALLR